MMADSRDKDGKLLTVRTLIALIVVVPTTVVSVALVAISTYTSRTIAEQLGDELLQNATAGASQEVENYLGEAVRVSRLYSRRIHSGVLPFVGDFKQWTPHLFDDLSTSADVASICFGNEKGDSTWLLRAKNRLELGFSNGTKDCEAIEYPADSTGASYQKPIRVYRYDPRVRPWYTAALQSESPVWTPIYFWFGEGGPDSETGTGYTRAIRNDNGDVIGVLVIDVTLGALSDFLRRMPITQHGYVYIVDDQGLLVASSEGSVNSESGKRMSPADAKSKGAQAVSGLVPPIKENAYLEHVPMTERVSVNDVAHRARITPLSPYPGINWRIVTVLPESSFLADAESLQRRAILLAALTVIGGLLLGLRLSRRLSEPMLKLADHVARLARGDFRQWLDFREARELAQISNEMNGIAKQLQQRRDLLNASTMAHRVQPSVLPPKTDIDLPPLPTPANVLPASRHPTE